MTNDKFTLDCGGGPTRSHTLVGPEVNTADLLSEREEIYGPAKPFYEALAKINDIFVEFTVDHGSLKSDASAEMMRMIFLKILRLTVTPKYQDNYTDIKGYLELIRRIEQDES